VAQIASQPGQVPAKSGVRQFSGPSSAKGALAAIGLVLVGTVSGLSLASSARAQSDIPALSQDDRNWVMPAKNYESTRFSGLDQINTQNVRQLRLAWSF
jgi:glucose dehydrogenase